MVFVRASFICVTFLFLMFINNVYRPFFYINQGLIRRPPWGSGAQGSSERPGHSCLLGPRWRRRWRRRKLGGSYSSEYAHLSLMASDRSQSCSYWEYVTMDTREQLQYSVPIATALSNTTRHVFFFAIEEF